MKEFLQKLKTRRRTMTFATTNPSSLAYKLREAIYASQFHDKYERFHELSALYTFEEGDGLVRARFLGLEPKEVKTEDGEPVEPETPDRPAMTVNEATTLEGVVGAAMSYEGTTDELRFPEAVLPPPSMEKLYLWAQENDWEIIHHEEEGLTLTRRDVPEEITWKPEEE